MKTLIFYLILTSTTFAEVEKKIYSESEFKLKIKNEKELLIKKISKNNLIDFSKELLEKEEAIKLKELKLKNEREILDKDMNDFKLKVTEFQEDQKKILGCIDSQNDKIEKRVSHLVEVISSMKPQAAAELLSVQDPDLSVRILGQLDSQKASKIFNLMTKEISAKLQKQFMEMKK